MSNPGVFFDDDACPDPGVDFDWDAIEAEASPRERNRAEAAEGLALMIQHLLRAEHAGGAYREICIIAFLLKLQGVELEGAAGSQAELATQLKISHGRVSQLLKSRGISRNCAKRKISGFSNIFGVNRPSH